MPDMKRSIKDSVFTLMFKEPKYALQLYQSLHPEDKDVTEADCKIVTLENILTVGQFNDLGLLVRDMLLLLTEAQSTFSVNIAPRVLMYVANSYKEYAYGHDMDLYGSRPVKLPRPELYVIYTGLRQDVPDTIHLSDLYEGAGDVDLRVHVIRQTGSGDILDQYVRFCQIVDENRRKYGRGAEAVEKILRQCREEGILAPFLASREKEVYDIMTTLFDQERAIEMYGRDKVKEGREEGRAEGRAEGTELTLITSIKSLMKTLGLTIEQAMDALSVPVEIRAKLQAQL